MSNKTTENDGDVMEYLKTVTHEGKRNDSIQLLKIFEEETGVKAKMWGASIIGFGRYHYHYDSGRQGDALKTGFAPRATSLTIYIMPGFERFEVIMKDLGKYKTSKSCLYIKKLSDVDEASLRKLIKAGYDYMTAKYG